jgi:hypothetical protein
MATAPIHVIVPENAAVTVTVPPGGVGEKKSEQSFTAVPEIVACALSVKLLGVGDPPVQGFPVTTSVTFSKVAVPTVRIGGLNFSFVPYTGHVVIPVPTIFGWAVEAEDEPAGTATRPPTKTPALTKIRPNTTSPPRRR